MQVPKLAFSPPPQEELVGAAMPDSSEAVINLKSHVISLDASDMDAMEAENQRMRALLNGPSAADKAFSVQREKTRKEAAMEKKKKKQDELDAIEAEKPRRPVLVTELHR